MPVQKCALFPDGPGLAKRRAMSRRRSLGLWVCSSLLVVTSAQIAQAQSASAAPPAQQEPEDLTQVVLAEPTFSLVNLPTTLRLPKFKMSFNLTHRFQGDLTEGTFSQQLGNLFGIDNGAIIGFELRFAPADHVQFVAYRNTLDKTLQLSGQFDFIRQRGTLPVSISPILSIEGGDNFSERFAPAVGAAVSRTIGDKAAMYAVPVWVHNSEGFTGATRDTFFIGLGARVRMGGRAYVVGEVVPRVSGYAPGDPAYAFGIEKRVGGHMFQLTFANSFSTTYGQLARGGFPNSLYFGFNLGRKFF